MRERDYSILWADVSNQTSTASYTYTMNTAYSTRSTTYVDCSDYCIKWFKEEENADTTEWEHLLEEGEK